jgi:hypothetical protein
VSPPYVMRARLYVVKETDLSRKYDSAPSDLALMKYADCAADVSPSLGGGVSRSGERGGGGAP